MTDSGDPLQLVHSNQAKHIALFYYVYVLLTVKL